MVHGSKQSRLAGLRGPENTDDYPSVVRKNRAHEKAGVTRSVAHLVQILLLHARDRLFLTAKTLDLFSIKDAKFPVFDHGAMWPLTRVRTSENVTELVRQLLKGFGLVTKEVELLEGRFPFRLPLPFNGLDLEIEDFGGSNN